MLLTTGRLIGLRLFNLTLGRLPAASRLLRGLLVGRYVRRAREPYVASSRFFDPRELGGSGD